MKTITKENIGPILQILFWIGLALLILYLAGKVIGSLGSSLGSAFKGISDGFSGIGDFFSSLFGGDIKPRPPTPNTAFTSTTPQGTIYQVSADSPLNFTGLTADLNSEGIAAINPFTVVPQFTPDVLNQIGQ